MVYQKMETLVHQMLDPETGVPIKTVKSFLSKVPSVFTGQDLIAWIMKNLEMSDLGITNFSIAKIRNRIAFRLIKI